MAAHCLVSRFDVEPEAAARGVEEFLDGLAARGLLE
jgi:hypothetical protein